MFGVVSNCIDHIFEGEKTFPAKDSTQKELKEFLESLPQSAFLKIKKFFDTMPQLRHEVEVTNPKTGVKVKSHLRDYKIFFNKPAHNSLQAYYETNFALMQHHKYSLTELR